MRPGEYRLPFGRYRGQTLDAVALADPRYLRWVQRESDAGPEVRTAVDQFFSGMDWRIVKHRRAARRQSAAFARRCFREWGV